MPRQQRDKSNTGYYHIMIRGNDRKDIFLDEQDKIYFKEESLEEKMKKFRERTKLPLRKLAEITGINKDKINKITK